MRCSSPQNISHKRFTFSNFDPLNKSATHTNPHTHTLSHTLRLAKYSYIASFDFPATNQVDCVYFYAIDEILVYSSHFTYTQHTDIRECFVVQQQVPVKCVCVYGNILYPKRHIQHIYTHTKHRIIYMHGKVLRIRAANKQFNNKAFGFVGFFLRTLNGELCQW